MAAWTWLWSERKRRNLVLFAVVVGGLALLVTVLTVRAHQAQDSWQEIKARGIGAMSTPVAANEDHDDLERLSGEATARSVLSAWLASDSTTLASVATPDLVFMLGEPPAGLSVVEPLVLSEDYDTFQSWTVALSDGTHADVSLSWARSGEDAWTATSVVVGA